MYKLEFKLCLFMRLLILFTFLPFVFFSQVANVSDFFTTIPTSGLIDYIDVTKDADANLIILGELSGNIDADPSVNEFPLASYYNGGYFNSVIVQKLNAQNELIWAKKFDFSTTPHSITTDNDNNIYITGDFYNTFDADPNASVFNLTSTGNADIFVLKLDQFGAFKWAKKYGQAGKDDFSRIVSNNTDEFLIYANKLIKIDTDGNEVWEKELTSNSFVLNKTIDISTNGTLILTGIFKDSVDVNFDQNNEEWKYSDSYAGIVVRIDSDGNYINSTIINPNNSSNTFFNIAKTETDALNNVYIAGNFKSKIKMTTGNMLQDIALGDATNYNQYILKLDENLNYEWIRTLASHNDYTYSLDIGVDAMNNVVMCSSFKGFSVLNTITNELVGESYPYAKFYVRSFSENGDFIYSNWGISTSGYIEAKGLYLDNELDPIIVGTFSGLTFFNSGGITPHIQEYSGSSNSGFLIKYSTQDILELGKLNSMSEFTVSPNPVSNELTIEGLSKDIIELSIYGALGNIIKTINLPEWETLTIDFSDFSTGIYFIKVKSKDSESFQKVIKK